MTEIPRRMKGKLTRLLCPSIVERLAKLLALPRISIGLERGRKTFGEIRPRSKTRRVRIGYDEGLHS